MEETPEEFVQREEVKESGVVLQTLKIWLALAGYHGKKVAIAFMWEAYNQIMYGQAYMDSKKRGGR